MGDNKENFVYEIVKAMTVSEQLCNNGSEKKFMTLNTIKAILDDDTFQRYLPLIDQIIDSLVSISKNDIELSFKKTRKCLDTFKINFKKKH